MAQSEHTPPPFFSGKVQSFNEIAQGSLGGYPTVQRYLQSRRSYFVRLMMNNSTDKDLQARCIKIIEAFDAANFIVSKLMEKSQ